MDVTSRILEELACCIVSATWWELTHDSEHAFYLEASMSLVSMFGPGIAMGLPRRNPLEGPDIQYRSGRHIEQTAGIRVFEQGV